MKESLFITWKKETLAATIDYPENMQLGQKYPLFIICHGFIGSKVGVDRLFVKTAEQLNRDQYIVLRFDYSGCGESSGDYGKTGLHDLIDQTRTIIEFAYQLPHIDQSQITLLGHSLGGATAILTAANNQRIKRLILWSSVARPYEDIRRIVGKEKVRMLKKEKVIDYLGYSFTKPFFDSLISYQPMETAVGISGNVLIIHGTGDEDIPVIYAKEYERMLTKRLSGHVLRHEIEGANHTFSKVDHFSELIAVTRSWVENQISFATKEDVSV